MKTNGRQRDWEGTSVMTNYEKIKGMSVEQMAKWLYDTGDCGSCNFKDCEGMGDCRNGHLEWLQQEATE